jgi:hypothetical protein
MLPGPNDPPGTGDSPEPVETPSDEPDTSHPDPQPDTND